jgi:hypothetical protein
VATSNVQKVVAMLDPWDTNTPMGSLMHYATKYGMRQMCFYVIDDDRSRKLTLSIYAKDDSPFDLDFIVKYPLPEEWIYFNGDHVDDDLWMFLDDLDNPPNELCGAEFETVVLFDCETGKHTIWTREWIRTLTSWHEL